MEESKNLKNLAENVLISRRTPEERETFRKDLEELIEFPNALDPNDDPKKIAAKKRLQKAIQEYTSALEEAWELFDFNSLE